MTKKKSKVKSYTRGIHKFCNILVHTSLWCIYRMTEAVQVVKVPTVVVSMMFVGCFPLCDYKATDEYTT